MKLYLSIILLCASTLLFAQKTALVGIVTDSLNNPVELANVMAFHKSDSTVASFGITNSEGKYRLILSQGDTYVLKASFIGYTTWQSEVTAMGELMKENLILKESPKILNEVEIKYEFPITISGDTITYKTDKFTTGNERKLGNVLEALPGFEVDDNGEIKVQGKKVNKVLVDGKEFFDGDSKMATKNIPANAVDKVQLLRNYNDVSPLNGLGNGESLAINVTLEEGKKNMLFGDVKAGVGPQERYIAHPNLFYYSPKTNINFIGDANNIGEQAFTLSDYFRFSGGMRRIGRNSGSMFDMSSDEFGMSLMMNNRAKNLESNLGALNLNYRPNSKWNFTGYGIVSSTDANMQTMSSNSYIRQQNQTQESTTSDLLQSNTSGIFKISSAYTPNHKAHIEYEAFLKASEMAEVDSRTSDFGTTLNQFQEKETKTPFSLDQTLLMYFTLNKKNILSAEGNWNYKKQIPKYDLSSNFLPLANVLPLVSDTEYVLAQNKKINTNAVQAELNHYYILNKTNHINFNVGIKTNYQQYDSYIQQQDVSGSLATITGLNFTNDVQFTFDNYYVGVHYKTKLGKLVLSPGLNANYYSVKDTQNGVTGTLQKNILMPDLFAQFKFGGSENITFNYGLKTQFTDVQNVALGGIVRNYNSYFVGNNALENVLFHDMNLNYFNFSMFNHTNFFAMINYQKKYHDINESVSYQNTDRIATPNNVDFWNDMLIGNINFEKKYVGLKIKTGANVSYMKFQNEVENQMSSNESLNQEYKLSLESSFSNAPNFEIGLKQGWNIYNSNSLQQEYLTSSPYAELEAAFLKHFTLVVEYEYTNYHSRDRATSSEYDFLNASLYFRKKDSAWEFKVTGKNLLSTDSIRRDGFGDNIVSTYAYYVQPRYFLFSVKYDL